MFKHALSKSLLVAAALCLPVACGEDDDPVETTEPAAECAAILEVCTHDVTTPLGEECHELAHENDADVCAEREGECVSHCKAELNAGGAGGGGGAAGAQNAP